MLRFLDMSAVAQTNLGAQIPQPCQNRLLYFEIGSSLEYDLYQE
jgi:hypothetical protein